MRVTADFFGPGPPRETDTAIQFLRNSESEEDFVTFVRAWDYAHTRSRCDKRNHRRTSTGCRGDGCNFDDQFEVHFFIFHFFSTSRGI